MAEFKEISPDDLEQQLAQEKPPALWDVREPEEWLQGQLPHAILRPLSQMSNWLPDVMELDGAIVIYCHSGVRSARLCEWMVDQGLDSVHNLSGGILRWAEEGKFLVKEGKPQTERFFFP
jgi:rhodanese-related sulfurtransferase